MGSCSPQLPLINLADKTLEPGSSKWAEVRSDVRKALEDFGCFEASYDKVSLELQESIVKTMEELFGLPVETKKRNVCPKPYVGYIFFFYVGYLNHNNLSESLGISNANILENINEFTQQLWPDGDGNENISKTIQLFAEKLVEIDVMVRRMVMESFEKEKHINEHLNSTNYLMRFMKYIAPPDGDANTTVDDNADLLAKLNIDCDDGVGPNVGVKVNADISDDVNANASAYADVGANVNDDTSVNDDLNVDAKANGDANVAVRGGVNANTDLGVGVNSNVDVNSSLTLVSSLTLAPTSALALTSSLISALTLTPTLGPSLSMLSLARRSALSSTVVLASPSGGAIYFISRIRYSVELRCSSMCFSISKLSITILLTITSISTNFSANN